MKYTYIFIFLLAGVLFMYSCTDMNDLFQPYLDEGEIVYAQKVDTVFAHPGNKRIQLEIPISSTRINEIRIFWNDYADSVIVQVNQQTGVFKKMIENLDEREYIFNVVTIDKFGNKSLPFEVTGNVYGEFYLSGLQNRSIMVAEFNDKNFWIIQWRPSTPDMAFTIVKYPINESDSATIIVPADSTITEIKDMPANTEYKYRTAYIPLAAIDTFYSDYTTKKSSYPNLMNLGGLIEEPYNDSPAAQGISKLIDNDVMTKYLTFHSSTWVLFHQTNPSVVARYAITCGEDEPSRDPSKWTLEASNDGSIWTVLDRKENINFSSRSETKYFDIQNNDSYTFYRLTLINHSGGIFQLSEWKLFGTGGGGTPVKITCFNETFASGIPSTWGNIDKDGDGYKWEYTGDQGGFAMTSSYLPGVGALSPENYLISPAITIPSDVKKVALRYDIASVSLNYYNEKYRILVSENPITEDNCRNATVLQDWQELTVNHRSWNPIPHTVSLQQFAGKTIYIAFLHGNCRDVYGLVLRNVAVVGYIE